MNRAVEDCGTTKCPPPHVTGPQKERRDRRSRQIYKEIMTNPTFDEKKNQSTRSDSSMTSTWAGWEARPPGP